MVSVAASDTFHAYSDPVIFRDDRVLRTLLKKETRYLPRVANFFAQVQTEVKAQMRKEVAEWMLEIAEAEHAQPEVFCLAMNYLDRFLSECPIKRSQLQLLAAVCLLVAWKVREHEPLHAQRLVEYSDFNLTLRDIMEWEVLLLSKLDWDMSSVIASDFIEHIIQRVRRFRTDDVQLDDNSVIRHHAETLLTLCSAHGSFSSLNPSLVAAASVLTTIRPFLEAHRRLADPVEAEAAAASPLSSGSSSVSSPGGGSIDYLEDVLDAVEKYTMIDKDYVREVMDRIEMLMRASLPPSPVPTSPRSESSDDEESRSTKGTEERSQEGDEKCTPTKILDVAKDSNR